jgi:hypothetical protein
MLRVFAPMLDPRVIVPVCPVPPILIVPVVVVAPIPYVEPADPSKLKPPLPTLCVSDVVPFVFPIVIALTPVPPEAMFTAPPELPVLIFVAKVELLFKLIAPPDTVVAPVTVAPDCPVNKPDEVIVPNPVVYILPLVVTASPGAVGVRVKVRSLRSQNPIVPEFGGVEVRFFVASVYTPAKALNFGTLIVLVPLPTTIFPPVPVPRLRVCAAVDEPTVIDPVPAGAPITIEPAVAGVNVIAPVPLPPLIRVVLPKFVLEPIVTAVTPAVLVPEPMLIVLFAALAPAPMLID